MIWSVLSPDRSVEEFDLYVLRFTDYGKEFPKTHNMSPDAFIQLALQLTYYKSALYCFRPYRPYTFIYLFEIEIVREKRGEIVKKQ